MDGEDGYGADSQRGPESPASAWPLIMAVVAILLGVVLLWWWNDEGSRLTAPVLGATIAVSVIILGTWMFENISQGRRKRRYGDGRKTQVITFGIAEGKYEDAQTGVLAMLRNAHEELRVEPGFEDLRVIVSRSDSGVSQAIVETTWSHDDDLTAFEATRKTILDRINGHPDEVVAGSVQAFDMDVLRDTKEVFVRMGFGAATTVLTALLIGGFAVGATIGATTGDEIVPSDGDGPVTAIEVVAANIAFDVSTITAVANEQFTVTFINDDTVVHNLKFLDAEGGQLLSSDATTSELVEPGETETITFTAPPAGSYFFFCSIHPTTMTGTFTTVDADEPIVVPTPTPSPGDADFIVTIVDGAADPQEKDATDEFSENEDPTDYSVNVLTVKAGSNVQWISDDILIHTVTAVDGSFGSEFLSEGDTFSFTFTEPGEFEYFCIPHPWMRAKVIVE